MRHRAIAGNLLGWLNDFTSGEEVVGGPAIDVPVTRSAWLRRIRVAQLQAGGGVLLFVTCSALWDPKSADTVPNTFAGLGFVVGLTSLGFGLLAWFAWRRTKSTIMASRWRTCHSFAVPYFRSTLLQLGDDGPTVTVMAAFWRMDFEVAARVSTVDCLFGWSVGCGLQTRRTRLVSGSATT